jgi:AAA family ATP:ADP antiporter
VRSWLGIEPGEGRVFVWGTLALGLLGWAEVSLRNASETLFVKRVGVALLPQVFLLNDALLLAATFAFVGVAAGSDRLRLLPRMLAALGVALLPLWALVGADLRSGLFALLVASRLVPALGMIVYWIAMADLLHGRQAKRLFAPITAGGTLGTAAGSFASEPLGQVLGIGGLLPVAAAMLWLAAAAALPLGRLRPRLDRLRRAPARARRAPARAPEASPRSFASLWRESGLFRLLVAIALCGGVLAPMLYFEFQVVADRATQGPDGEARLFAFYAWFRGAVPLAVLPAQIFATSSLFQRFGMPLASALPPVVYLAGFAGLAAQPTLGAGVGAMAATQLQDKAVHDPALRVLFSLFPESIRSRASALIEGPLKRSGGVIGNALVFGALSLGSAALVAAAALPIALAWLAASLWLWRRYPQLLLRSAAQRTRGGALEYAELLDRATVRALAAELVSDDGARARAAISLVADAEPLLAAEAFAAALRRAPAGSRGPIVAALDGVLEAGAPDSLRSPEAARAIESLLAEPGELGDRDRADLVQAFSRLAPRSGGHAALEAALADASPAVRLAALAALDRRGAAPPGADLDAELARALAGPDAAARRTAREECRWSLLSGVPGPRFDARLALLAGLLADPAERAAAAEAIAEVAAARGDGAASVAERMLALRGDDEPGVRSALLRYAGHAGLVEQATWLVAHLASPREPWSLAAREGLHALGPRCADVLLRELAYGPRAAQAPLVGLVRELDVGREEIAALYEREIEAVRRHLLHVAALGDRERFAIVRQRLLERVDEQLHAALGLLAALHEDDRIAELGEQLRFARGGRRHSIVLEALESLVGRERSRLIPLLEEGDLGTRGRLAAEALGRSVPKLEEALDSLLADPEELTRSLVAGTALAGRAALGDHAAVKPIEIALQLRSLPFFEALTTRQLVDLAGVVREEQHAPGAAIAREGAFDDCLYLLVEGVVRVTRGGTLLNELGPGSFFGEVALFEGGARTATVEASSHVRLLRLERADLIALMEDLPGLAFGICQALARRVSELTQRLERATMRSGADADPGGRSAARVESALGKGGAG